jgi:hypothetical protein
VTSSIHSSIQILRRPRIQPALEGGWYVLLGSHGWLCGDRRAALNEFHELDCIENHPTPPTTQKDFST